MEKPMICFPPNKPMERNLDFSKHPVIYKHLCFLDFNEEGESILGASNVNGTVWEGTTLNFKNPKSMIELKYSSYYINSSVCDGKFLNKDHVVLAEDCGALNILRIEKEKGIMEPQMYFKHFDRISQMALWRSTQKILTCAGRILSIFDLNAQDCNPVREFVDYHTESINAVDCMPGNTNIFLSAAKDRKACIWDERNEKPATVLYTNEFASLTTISGHPKDTNFVTIGSEAGDIYLIDKRKPGNFLQTIRLFNSPLFRTVYSPDGKYLAVCGDTPQVLVLDTSVPHILTSVYNSKKVHDEIARGLAWFKDELYSCGFDKKIVKHSF